MKENELMIGDWVCATHINGKENVKVLEFNTNSFCVKNSEGMWYYHTSSLIEPILLNEEILKLNGWKRHYDMRLMDEPEYYHDKVCFRLCRSFGILFMYVGDSAFMEMSYVHKFQHALRLCGLNELADNLKLN